MQELVNDFIHESIANLDRTEQLVESLGTDDVWLIEQNIRILFRTFHTIKGVAGFLQFAVMQALTHEAETLFDGIRKRPARQSEPVLQAIYQAFDCIRYIIREVEKYGSDISAREMAETIIAHVRQFIAPDERVDLDGNIISPRAKPIYIPKPAPSPLSLPRQPIRASDITFLREKAAVLRTAVNKIVPVEAAFPEDDYSAAMRERVNHLHRLITELSESPFLPEDSEPCIIGQGASVFSDMMASGDLVLNETTLLTLHSQVNSFVDALELFLRECPQGDDDAANNSSETTTTYALLQREENTNQENTLRPEGNVHDVLPNALRFNTQLNASPDDMTKAVTYTDRSEIRVETSKLDRLFDLMSELVTLQTMTLNNPDLQDLDLPNFQKSATMLAKNIRQLQGVTMSMRMTPIEILFAKMKRITREVSAQLGKRVELRMSGADTEMDKNVIELLFDPLVHILRNAIDHGIESTEERERVGKSATGVIHLSALYEGNEILISVRDDGGGLNRTKILHRAIERGIATPNAEELTDEEIWNFIFEPGFSTAETVTDVSGRGVGMDVVKQNIGQMRGSVQVRSREGKGTTITLRIPLTLASMDVILVRVGDTHYAIPIGSVRQSFRPEPEDITTTMDGLEVVRVRETLYTIVRLHELFQQRTDNAAIDQGILVIVEAKARTVCLFVDEIVGQQQTVIKPLAKYIGEVRGLNGCMILSDGTIGLILDVEELIRIAEDPLPEPV